jgi:cytochrome c2
MQHRKRYLFASQLLLVLFSGMFISHASAMGGGMQGMMQGGDLKTLPPGLPAELLPEPQSSGAKLLQRYCAQCHPLPGPGRHTAEDWPAVLKRMVMNMQHMSGGMMSMMMGTEIDVPTRAEQRTLRIYLQNHAQRSINTDQFPELNSTAAGRAFAATCARCHVLPDPRQKTAIEWIGVEGRMQRNMNIMGRSIPDEATLQQILIFLQERARKDK